MPALRVPARIGVGAVAGETMPFATDEVLAQRRHKLLSPSVKWSMQSLNFQAWRPIAAERRHQCFERGCRAGTPMGRTPMWSATGTARSGRHSASGTSAGGTSRTSPCDAIRPPRRSASVGSGVPSRPEASPSPVPVWASRLDDDPADARTRPIDVSVTTFPSSAERLPSPTPSIGRFGAPSAHGRRSTSGDQEVPSVGT